MAITILSTPAAYSSVQSDLIFTVAEVAHTADPVSFPNYKFIADVYVGATLVARLKAVPRPDTLIGIFNIGQIVRNYITTVFNPTADVIKAQELGIGEFDIAVTVKFGEEYSYTAYYALTVDTERTYFNNYNKRGELVSLAAKVDTFLTDRPSTTPVKCNSSFNFIPYFPTTASLFTVTVKSYDYSNTLATTLNYNITPAAAKNLIQLNASKDAINASSPGMIHDGIKYYTVEVAGDLYRFNMECECIHDIYTIHFLNRYGGFETKDFSKVSRKTISIEKKDFGKLPYTVDSSGVVSYKSANNVYNESRSVYSSIYKEKMTLNSDLLTDAEYQWLEQLVLSPMVYIEQDGEFFPCVISETNYEHKKIINDELTNLTINIEFGDQNNAQFR